MSCDFSGSSLIRGCSADQTGKKMSFWKLPGERACDAFAEADPREDTRCLERVYWQQRADNTLALVHLAGLCWALLTLIFAGDTLALVDLTS